MARRHGSAPSALALACGFGLSALSCGGSMPSAPETPQTSGASHTGTVAAHGAGLSTANNPPLLVWKTKPEADTATTPPSVSGLAPLTVRFNLCHSSDPDQDPDNPAAGDALNWQFHFGDSGEPAFHDDGTFNADFARFCRVDHTYAAGEYLATLSVTDKNLHDQSADVVALARAVQQIRVVAATEPPPPTPSGSMTFSFTGAVQDFQVPLGVTQLTVTACGAQGGSGGGGGAGALGGCAMATIAVTPGGDIEVNVGGQGGAGSAVPGAGGFNGGGGGGSGASVNGGGGGGGSDVRPAPYGLGNRLVVGGGGGGGGGTFSGGGGAGGGVTGAAGEDGSGGSVGGGGGGTQAGGGDGGTGGGGGGDGSIGGGGSGGISGFSGGSGGGGGYYGGGGGGGSGPDGISGGGGGGSSFTVAGATGVGHQQGVQTGNGEVTLTW